MIRRILATLGDALAYGVGVMLIMLGVLMLGFYWVTTPAHPAEFVVVKQDRLIEITGEIEDKDDKRLLLAWEQLPPGPKHVQIWLNSDGGNWDVANGMRAIIEGKQLNGWRIASVVSPLGMCGSSCVTLFAAADERWVVGSGYLMVHTVMTKTGLGYAADQADAMRATYSWMRYLESRGMPPVTLLRLAQTTSRAGIRIPDAELCLWKVNFTPTDRCK